VGIPTPEINQDDTGRFWEATFHAKWTAADAQNMSAELFVDNDLFTAYVGDVGMSVTDAEWTSNLTGTLSVYFDSAPITPANSILELPSGASSGEIDLCKMSIKGGRPDPNRRDGGVGGNIVIDTLLAADGDEVFIKLKGKVKGTRRS